MQDKVDTHHSWVELHAAAVAQVLHAAIWWQGRAHHVVSNKSYCLPIELCIISLVMQGRANLDRLSRCLTAVVGFLMVRRTSRTYHLKRHAMALMRGLSRISPSSASGIQGACAAPWLQNPGCRACSAVCSLFHPS